MAEDNITLNRQPLNDQIDDLAQRIKQAQALAHVLSTEDFDGFSKPIKDNYHWALWTLLDEADELINRLADTAAAASA